jgi:DNA repair exonuclease SbcCD ATPase subunit
LTVKRAKAEEYKRKDAQLKELHNALVNTPTVQPVKGNGKVICLLLGVLGMLGGVVLMILQQLIVGVALTVVGFGLCASGVFLHTQKTKAGIPNVDVTVKIAGLQAELRVLEEELRAFTVPYRYYSEAGVLFDFTSLEKDVGEYQAQKKTLEEDLQKFNTTSQEMEEIRSNAKAYLLQYGEEGDLHEGLNRLLSSVSTYQSLLADQAAASGKMEDVRARIEESKTTAQEILKKYALPSNMGTMDGLNQLEVDCKHFVELGKDVEDIDVKLTTYKENNDLTERPETQKTDTDEMHGKLSILRKQLADCDKRIAEIERMVEKLPDTESELEQAEEKLDEYKAKHQLLSDVIDALKGAEKALQDRYVAPIRDRFSHYATILEKVLDEKISMDSDYRVQFERGGENRSDRHLSAGERSLCALCLRLALIDNMYEGEQPFIVMDDPFVHLDEEHLKRVAELMKELSKERQILYFCCHTSRSLAQ